jgi:hypothetical protein
MDLHITGNINKEFNPKWPPNISSLVVFNIPNQKFLFIGKVFSINENNTLCVILLVNEQDYIDNYITENKLLPPNIEPTGFSILVPSMGWRYVDRDKFSKILKSNRFNLNKISSDIKFNYDKLLVEISNPPTSQLDLLNEAKFNEDKDTTKTCNVTDEPINETLLTERGKTQMENLFKDKEINQQLYSPTETFTELDHDITNALLRKIKENEEIKKEDIKYIVNKTVSIENLIESKADENEEGQKIIKYITEELLKINISDLKFAIFNGYVYMTRIGINVDDIITPDLVPDLKYFNWQYNIPIDYDTLKYILFQNPEQKKIISNIEQQKEAEKIFQQEYLICLQPEPKHQAFCIKRLIMCWYADNILQKYIRKIKILINQWRAKIDSDFNKVYGVLPSIIIYPRYGKDCAKQVLSLINTYFMFYQNIGWKCSYPSYFVKVSDLVYYTNGSIDLKLYFRKTVGVNNKLLNNNNLIFS